MLWAGAISVLTNLATGCASSQPHAPGDGRDAMHAIRRVDPMVLPTFLPTVPADACTRSLTVEQGRIVEMLMSLQEPSLQDPDNKRFDSIRVSVVPSLRPSAVVRIVRLPNGTAVLIAKWKSLVGDEGAHSTWLTAKQEADTLALLDQNHFWSLGSDCELSPFMDGTTWAVEATKAGEYHAIVRWMGGRSDPAQVIGRHLLKVAGLQGLLGPQW